ncbi:hypothetical protein BDP55DRAFT_670751 [Colletotrichum godetiae]|uniref:Uncharacterized protein n=1 Tax=Colletotrichum godetiae TaxID=1209918 RepID=A0AAJ0AIX4_9PEZI|nr:uncharacterized protein BDP55DRAFT_670751 [Colletotrichum godetiae]KAK1673288.1 hypothetical protein BDP55DRAFT_670751 [Colletotrichum godetiae]
MGKHGEFSHDSLEPHRMVVLENCWPKFFRSIELYCGPFIEILDDQQRFRLDSRHEIGYAKQDWTIQLSHQTANSFLQTPGRSGEFYIDPASAERMVTTQSCRYLGIRASSPGQICYRSTAEGKGDPILALKVALTPLLRDSSLLATKQYVESTKRPLAKFALDVILKSCPDNEAIFGALMMADLEGLAPRDWVAVHWLADMCFTPTLAGTSLEPFIFFCCVHGQTEALKTFSRLKDEYSGEYKTRLMAVGRNYQIICGAAEAFIKIREDNDTCLAARTLEALHTLCKEKLRQMLRYCSTRVASNLSRGETDYQGESERLENLESRLSEQRHQPRKFTQNLCSSKRKLSSSDRIVGCRDVNEVFQEVDRWMKSDLTLEMESDANKPRHNYEPVSEKDRHSVLADIERFFPLNTESQSNIQTPPRRE